jgi:hypothetical protein
MISDTSSSRTIKKIQLLHYINLKHYVHRTHYLCNIIEMVAKNNVRGPYFNWIYPILKLILLNTKRLKYEALHLPLVLLNHLTYTKRREYNYSPTYIKYIYF